MLFKHRVIHLHTTLHSISISSYLRTIALVVSANISTRHSSRPIQDSYWLLS
jgi:hypothetical protein